MSAGFGESFCFPDQGCVCGYHSTLQDPFPALKGNVTSSTIIDMLDCEATSIWERLRKSQNVSFDFQTNARKEI